MWSTVPVSVPRAQPLVNSSAIYIDMGNRIGTPIVADVMASFVMLEPAYLQ